MKFNYKNYALRKAQTKDAKNILEITSDKEVMKFYGESGAFLKSEDQALEEIQWINNLFNIDSSRWVIIDEIDTYIGDVGL